MSYVKLLLIYLILSLSFASWTMNNWLMIWYLMEVSFVLFMGLCVAGGGYSVSEMMMKYYLIQVCLSLIMLVFMLFYMFNLVYMHSYILVLGLLTKMGMFPFHFWFIMICGKIEWMSFFILGTFMKLIPLILVYYLFSVSSLFFTTAGSIIFGSLMGLNSGVIQKMMGYSSMINICWAIYSLSISLNLFFFYFLSYMIMLWWLIKILAKSSTFYINQFSFNHMSFSKKVMVFIYSLSIAGFPPWLGFMTKWMVVNYFWYLGFKFLMSLMILFSVVAIYFYLQLAFFVMLVFSSWLKWYYNNFIKLGLVSFVFLLSYLILFMFY